jgi:hypothetical protein
MDRWEIQWWLQHREAETLLVPLTGGDDPEADPATLFPPEIVAARAHRRMCFSMVSRTVRPPMSFCAK